MEVRPPPASQAHLKEQGARCSAVWPVAGLGGRGPQAPATPELPRWGRAGQTAAWTLSALCSLSLWAVGGDFYHYGEEAQAGHICHYGSVWLMGAQLRSRELDPELDTEPRVAISPHSPVWGSSLLPVNPWLPNQTTFLS